MKADFEARIARLEAKHGVQRADAAQQRKSAPKDAAPKPRRRPKYIREKQPSYGGIFFAKIAIVLITAVVLPLVVRFGAVAYAADKSGSESMQNAVAGMIGMALSVGDSASSTPSVGGTTFQSVRSGSDSLPTISQPPAGLGDFSSPAGVMALLEKLTGGTSDPAAAAALAQDEEFIRQLTQHGLGGQGLSVDALRQLQQSN